MSREKIKRWVALSMLAVLAMLSWGSSGCGTALPVAPQEGAQAPGFTLTTLDEGIVELDELKGQPVLLNFWATWCGWCRYQMPFFQAAFEEKGHEVKIIGINLRENSNMVQQFVEGEGVAFTVALDPDGTAASAYNIRSIPATFLIDEQGVIKYIRIGAFTSQAELMAVLEDL